MRHSVRRITALAAACALGGTQGCMSYRAAPNGLKIDDRVRVAATTPLTPQERLHRMLGRRDGSEP